MTRELPRRSILASGVSLAAAAGLAHALPRRRETQGEELEKLGYTTVDHRAKPLATRTKFAVNIEMWGFGTNDHAERIRKAADLGFRGVEMWPWRGKDLDAIAKALKETDVQLVQFTAWGFSPGLNDPKNHDAFVGEIEASCEVAKRLGVPMMTVVAGNDQPGMTQAQMHQHVIDGLKRAAPIAEKHGITLILEPMNVRVDHKGHCLYGSPDAVRICKAVGSKHVKINWDLYHMQISEGDLCGRMRDGFDEIAYLQLAGHPGRHEPGTGEVHYNRVLEAAWELGYRGWVGLECSPIEGEAKAVERVVAADVW